MLFSCLGVSSLSLLPQRSLLRMAIACTSSAGESSLQLTPFWRQRLAELTKPAAIALVPYLSTENALCFENKVARTSGTLVEFAVLEKEKRPDQLLLIRVGEFYEAFGFDALMLVQWAGLNPMGSKCRAGCPVQNVQATLDALTSAGLTVAVYEEVAPAGTGEGRFRKLKQRVLAQVVSPASPVYHYEACLSPYQIDYAEPPPFAGVSATASGYMVVLVHLDSRAWRLYQRLSPAALHALLSARPHAPPLLINDLGDISLPRALAHLEKRALNVPSPGAFPQAMIDFVAEVAQVDGRSFRQLPSRGEGLDAPPTPLFMSTATQIGLLPAPGVPDLMRSVLPPDAPAACVHLLRRWLLLPPRPSVADAMHDACAELVALSTALPRARPVPIGKLVSLLLARQANAPLFLELRQVLAAVHAALRSPELARLNKALLALVAEESGLRLSPSHLAESAHRAHENITGLVADSAATSADEPCTDAHGLIPEGFFKRNEGTFRKLIRRERVAGEYAALEAAARELCDGVAEDVRATGQIVVHDTINNAIYLRRGTGKLYVRRSAAAAAAYGDSGDGEGDDLGGADGGRGPGSSPTPAHLEPARDRNKRVLANRYLSVRMREATVRYLEACDCAERAVKEHLQRLCDELAPAMPTLVTAAHWVLLSTTLAAHVGYALEQRWALPLLRPASDADRRLELEGVWPYWLPQHAATPNTLAWDGLWLLTAPNMAGKSSLMRSMLVAALLANSGLLAPVRSATVPRYDAFFLRTTSFDAPAEGKSAFAQEMDDLQLMTREGTRRSLLMLDEIGRGTSTNEGTALSAALLEWLDRHQMSAVFATHLHELESLLARLPTLPSLRWMCLPVAEAAADGRIAMSFTLSEGMSRNSLALHVARGAGLPADLVERAEALLAGMSKARAEEEGGEVEGGEEEEEEEGEGSTGTAAEEWAATILDVEAAAKADEQRKSQLCAAGEVLRALSGSDHLVQVHADWQPPPRLNGRSCVYVLQLGAKEGAQVSGSAVAPALYVGESDSIGRRLQQHRRRHADRLLECVLVEVESKSAARELETRTIRRLKELGLGRVRNVVKA